MATNILEVNTGTKGSRKEHNNTTMES